MCIKSPATVGLQPIKGPVLVAPTVVATPDAPASMTLWDESARAMRAFERADMHNFAVGAWKFTAHPIRASEPVCLRCHRANGTTSIVARPLPEQSLRIGDARGVGCTGFSPDSRSGKCRMLPIAPIRPQSSRPDTVGADGGSIHRPDPAFDFEPFKNHATVGPIPFITQPIPFVVTTRLP